MHMSNYVARTFDGVAQNSHLAADNYFYLNCLTGAFTRANCPSYLTPRGFATLRSGAVDALHAACGLPWWASIGALAVGVRAAMLPMSLQGLKASAALMPLLRQARQPAGDGAGVAPSRAQHAVARLHGVLRFVLHARAPL